MRSLSKKTFYLAVSILSAVPLAMAGTISGTVKGPEGAPFEGAFVEARHMTTGISTDVLSQEDGSFTVPNLPTGTYRLAIRAVGYKADPQSETLNTADQHADADFSLQKGKVQWSDLSVWQARELLPNGPGKEALFANCFGCHNFQSRMATRRLDNEGWMDLVNYMRNTAADFAVGPKGVPRPVTDQMAGEIAGYLTQVFGADSTLPDSPADVAGYNATVHKFSPEALNIVYNVYPLKDKTWLPFQAYPPSVQKGFDSDGYIWAADYGNANRVVRINPETGENTTYMSPCSHAAGIHAIEVGPDGNAWFAEQGCNRVGEVITKTGQVKQFDAPFIAQSEWGIRGGAKHDSHPMLVDGKLYVFSSGDPASRLDPSTGKFTTIEGIPNTYDVYGDTVNGKVWFTSIAKNDPIYEVDPKTLKTVLKFSPSTDPKDFESHRIAIDSKGIVWLTCYSSSRVCRLDPNTKDFKTYTPEGPDKHDYAIAVDHSGDIWYSMTFLDEIQRLDPKTGKIVEYPFPYPEITMRKFWPDAQGRIWTSSPANGVVVSWYLAGSNMLTAKK